MSYRLQTSISDPMFSALRKEAKNLKVEDENDVVRFILSDYFKRKSYIDLDENFFIEVESDGNSTK